MHDHTLAERDPPVADQGLDGARPTDLDVGRHGDGVLAEDMTGHRHAGHQVHRAVGIPIIGVGGIMTIDDCMEFFVAGASAVQIGTASFAEPVVSARLLDELPGAVAEAGAASLAELVGTLELPAAAGCRPAASEEP